MPPGYRYSIGSLWVGLELDNLYKAGGGRWLAVTYNRKVSLVSLSTGYIPPPKAWVILEEGEGWHLVHGGNTPSNAHIPLLYADNLNIEMVIQIWRLMMSQLMVCHPPWSALYTIQCFHHHLLSNTGCIKRMSYYDTLYLNNNWGYQNSIYISWKLIFSGYVREIGTRKCKKFIYYYYLKCVHRGLHNKHPNDTPFLAKHDLAWCCQWLPRLN